MFILSLMRKQSLTHHLTPTSEALWGLLDQFKLFDLMTHCIIQLKLLMRSCVCIHMCSYLSRHVCSRHWGSRKRWRGGGWRCRGRWPWSCTSAGFYYCRRFLRGDAHKRVSHIHLIMERRRLKHFNFPKWHNTLTEFIIECLRNMELSDKGWCCTLPFSFKTRTGTR